MLPFFHTTLLTPCLCSYFCLFSALSPPVRSHALPDLFHECIIWHLVKSLKVTSSMENSIAGLISNQNNNTQMLICPKSEWVPYLWPSPLRFAGFCDQKELLTDGKKNMRPLNFPFGWANLKCCDFTSGFLGASPQACRLCKNPPANARTHAHTNTSHHESIHSGDKCFHGWMYLCGHQWTFKYCFLFLNSGI